MSSSRRPSRFLSTMITGTLALACLAIVGAILARPVHAGFPWFKKGHHTAPCPLPVSGIGEGEWYWMRSPEQEQQVVMGLYARYCIRCHGVDGRGVWDIPGIPDFTNPKWHASRPDPALARSIIEGRGAVMPTFRGTLTLEEAWAMARYLRTFVPGTEVSRPDLGRTNDSAGSGSARGATAGGVSQPAQPSPAPSPSPLPSSRDSRGAFAR
jgi:Cytochrome C oxidase, cbb3-type, subunit III